MKFVHLADCHLGAWRDPRMKELTYEAFQEVTSRILKEQPDFVLIAGDLFHSALPGIETLRAAVEQLKRLKDAGLSVYCIAGSHDASPGGKSILDVLEAAGLVKDVMRGEVVDGKIHLSFTKDAKTGVKLTGILGRRGNLEEEYYEDLERESLEREPGPKIFLFHSSITELKPSSLGHMESQPASMLPKGFEYYAGGHVHIVRETSLPGYKSIVYPGPLFPASFSELEELGCGHYVVVDDWRIRRERIVLRPIISRTIDASNRRPGDVQALLEEAFSGEMKDALVLLRVAGELREGRVAQIDFRSPIESAYTRGAYVVMKNAAGLSSSEFEEIRLPDTTPERAEERLIREHAGQQPIGLGVEEEVVLTQTLMRTLAQQQHDGEKRYEYESRVTKDATRVLEER